MFDEKAMRKEGRSAALQEVLDLLTRLEMERHAPKKPEASPGADAGMMGESAAAPPADVAEPTEAESTLSAEDIEAIRAKLDEMR